MSEPDVNTWLEEAKKAGYEVLPKKDLENLQNTANALKSLRETIPEDYRGKEVDFVKEAQNAFAKLKEYEDKNKSETERLQSEISALKGQHTKVSKRAQELEEALTTTKKQLKEALVWGHISKVMQSRNVAVHDRIIETESKKKIEEFDLDQFSTDSDDGVKKLHDAIFKEIIEPAANLQAEIVGQVGKNTAPPASNTQTQAPGQQTTTPDDKASQFVMWGSKA